MTTELESWAARMRAESLSERTISERLRAVQHCAAVTGRSPLELREDDVVTWLTAPHLSAGSRQKYFSSVRTWSLYLLRTGLRSDDPTEHLRSPRVPRRQPRPVSDEHLEAVLSSRIHRRTRVMIHLMAYQGLRRHEVAKVRGEDVDLLSGTFTVLGKGGTTRQLPLHDVIRADAASMPRRGWWFPAYDGTDRPVKAHSVGGVVALALRRTGGDATGHQLRHWYGTTLLAKGVDVRIVQELMRHDSLNTTALYTRVHPDQQRAGLAMLQPVDERPRPARNEAQEAA